MLRNRSRRALIMLWLGLAAMSMNALASMNHVRPAAGANGMAALEICTLRGIVKLDPATMAPIQGEVPVSHGASKPGCCDLCGTSSAAAVPHVTSLVAISVAVAVVDAQAPPEAVGFVARHPELTPLVPRGPPALS